MATKKQPTENNTISIKEARQRLKGIGKKENFLAGFGSNQPNQEEPLFSKQDFQTYNLIKPPYNPSKLVTIAESGGKLSTCVEVYVTSIEGYGYEFRYTGNKEQEDSKDVVQELEALQGFFSQVNERQSLTKLRKELRRDYEITGNAYVEVLWYPTNEIAALYRADPRYTRLQAKQTQPVEVTVNLVRNGKDRPTKLSKRFRRFAMMVGGNTNLKIRFFKEFGDPRRMCAITGKYEQEYDEQKKQWVKNEIKEEATEILHIKQGNDIYGIPRWAGLASAILGVNDADYVNYDLFQSNAIPFLAILVSGGRLAAESVDDIAEVLEGMKGSDSYHKIAILEALAADADGNLEDKATGARVDFKELGKADDSLFQNYIIQTEKRIMACFRLPPILTGEVSDYSRATSSTAKLLTEDAVFGVERRSWDEIFNFTVMNELGAQYHKLFTIGPRLLEGGELIDSIGKLARAGALSVNQSVRLSNRILDLDTPPYTGEWANIPVALLLELMKRQNVTTIDGVGINPAEVEDAANKIKEIADKSEFEGLSEIIDELKDQMDEVYAMVSRMEG